LLKNWPSLWLPLESDTRRQAATEFTQALMEQFDQEVTNIIKGFITSFLGVSQVIACALYADYGYIQDFSSNPTANWKSKDTAIYLLTSIAARGSTTKVRFLLLRFIAKA
jgi:exportin-2 (importin alpha re-exporter)